jgi:uncharacterized OsmC-like protein
MLIPERSYMDVRGALGLSDEVRNGFECIRVTFKVHGDASAEKILELLDRAQRRSAVFDMVTHGVPVTLAAITDEADGSRTNGTSD